MEGRGASTRARAGTLELTRFARAQGRPLQTELLKGMESHLGVKVPGEHWKGMEPPEPESTTVPSKNRTIFEMVDVESVRSPSVPVIRLRELTA